MRKRKLVVSALLCLLIVLAGGAVIAAALLLRPASSKASTPDNDTPERVPNVAVRVLKATTVEDRLELTGMVRAWETIMLSAEIAGRIEWQGVEEGDAVKAGQELFRIDTEAIRARLAEAQAHHTLAVREFERARQGVSEDVSPKQALDNAVAARDVAAATLRMAQIQLQKSVVTAPFDGVVDRIIKKRDEFVDMGAPLTRLVQVHKVKIDVGIPERDIPYFAAGEQAKVAVDALPGKVFTGTIHRIATTAELETHTFPAEVEVDNVEGLLRPGMVARLTLVRQSFPDSLLVPVFATVLLDDKRYVFVEEDGVARVRSVEVGVVQGSEVQVTAGLAPGDRLIVVGQRDARDGERVNVQEVQE